MDWICYVFKRGKYTYLVADDSVDDAWIALAKRQSMSVSNCMKQYSYLGFMNGNSGVLKF